MLFSSGSQDSAAGTASPQGALGSAISNPTLKLFDQNKEVMRLEHYCAGTNSTWTGFGASRVSTK